MKKFFDSHKVEIVDAVKRAGWTFVQAFAAFVAVAGTGWSKATLVGAVGAGLSAVKTLSLTWYKRK